MILTVFFNQDSWAFLWKSPDIFFSIVHSGAFAAKDVSFTKTWYQRPRSSTPHLDGVQSQATILTKPANQTSPANRDGWGLISINYDNYVLQCVVWFWNGDKVLHMFFSQLKPFQFRHTASLGSLHRQARHHAWCVWTRCLTAIISLMMIEMMMDIAHTIHVWYIYIYIPTFTIKLNRSCR